MDARERREPHIVFENETSLRARLEGKRVDGKVVSIERHTVSRHVAAPRGKRVAERHGERVAGQATREQQSNIGEGITLGCCETQGEREEIVATFCHTIEGKGYGVTSLPSV